MVRLKQRYILFEILYPPTDGDGSENSYNFYEFSKSAQNALLILHQTSPAEINPKSITRSIRCVIQDHFGDFGVGVAGMLLSVRYFSNKTSTGIIRCGRQHYQMIVAALALMNRIGHKEVVVRCIHISGTIKKCEEYSIARNRRIMSKLKLDNRSDLNSFIANFGESNDILQVSDDSTIQ